MARLHASPLLCAMLLAACDGSAAATGSPRGAKCTSDGDCQDLHCIAKLEPAPKDLAALPLVCGSASVGRSPGQACEQANDCANGICVLAGACAAPCGTDGDCGKRERCQAVFARASANALQTLDACVAMANLPKDATVEVTVQPRALGVGITEIDLAPAEAEGETLYVLENLSDHWPEDGDCRPPLCVRELHTRAATPELLFSATDDYIGGAPPRNPVATGDQIDPAVIMLPSGAGNISSPVGYTARAQVATSGKLRLTRLARHSPGQRLDLNVFYVGGLGWQPDGDRGPPLLADAFSIVDQILGQADIFIGDVRQIAVPGALPARGTAFPTGDSAQGFAVIQVRFGVYVELPGLFRLSAGAGNGAINLFFVQDIRPRSSDGEPEAEAGGIPGPLGMQGTAGSGIAIATDMMAGDANGLGRTLAHEIAHYLGLFHTSEADGSVLDALDDTPECRIERDTARDGLDVKDCDGFGTDNLMFWAKTTGTVLTTEQRAVLRAAIVLQ